MGLLVVLLLHLAVVAVVVGRASPWATMSLDCVPGTVAEAALFEPGWGAFQVVDGAVWSQVLAGLAALPGYVALGTENGLVGKAAAWLLSVGLLLVVYALMCRAAGPEVGALAAAGVAFAPPVLFHTSLILGNWHWTGLLFDYGALLIALRIGWWRAPPDSPTRWARWPGFALLGLTSGLAMLNSPKSLPFVALAWLVALSGTRPRRWLEGAAAGLVGGALGAAPLLRRFLAAGPPGEGGGRDPIWAQLFDFRPELSKLLDLAWRSLPGTLHLEEVLGATAGRMLGSAWVLCCWTGCLVALGAILWTLRSRPDRDGGSLVALAVPLAFCAAFAAAYVVINTRIRILPAEFSNFRQHSHMMLTPLLAGMAVGSAGGWGWLWGRANALRSPTWRRAIRSGALFAALLPAAVGLLSQAAIARDAPGVAQGGLHAFRGNCFDISGFFAAGKNEGAPGETERICDQLSLPERRADCRAGAAWGQGFNAARLVPDGRYPSDRPAPSGRLCRDVPPDLRARCGPWREGARPALDRRLDEVCGALPGLRRDGCFMGGGWLTSQIAWGTQDWPLEACESLGTEPAREACWGGAGFHAAGHLGNTPPRLRSLLLRVPVPRRQAAAAGAGLLLGRTWAAEAVARSTCDQLGAGLREGCLEGVAAGRSHAFPR